MYVTWLGDRFSADSAVAGGKAAALSHLAARFPVPPGFVVSVAAYGQSLAETGKPALTPLLRYEVAEAYRRLGNLLGQPQPAVAVRSSAVDEDGATASFAGQHETYLNLQGAEAVLAGIERCWESARTDRALQYRREHGMTDRNAGVAVLVQALVPADVSAVVFSQNPVTSDPVEVVINAAWGLGESIVGGTVSPDMIRVEKRSLRLLESRLAEKERMTVVHDGGTREVKVPAPLRRQPSLTPEQAVEMARLAIRLEEEFGYPIDMECAWAGGRLTLLQCRPITTLVPCVPA